MHPYLVISVSSAAGAWNAASSAELRCSISASLESNRGTFFVVGRRFVADRYTALSSPSPVLDVPAKPAV